jgi:hypothetical protein
MIENKNEVSVARSNCGQAAAKCHSFQSDINTRINRRYGEQYYWLVGQELSTTQGNIKKRINQNKGEGQ